MHPPYVMVRDAGEDSPQTVLGFLAVQLRGQCGSVVRF